MRIKRFVASDMREAIRTVRETFGPDAVILSNRNVEEGVEVVAAVDYDDGWDLAISGQPESPPRNSQSRSRREAEETSLASARGAGEARLLDDHQRQSRVKSQWIEDSDPGAAEPTQAPAAAKHPALAVPPDLQPNRNRALPAQAQAQAPRPRAAARPAERSRAPAEPLLTGALEQELRSLRGLLEQQMSSLAWGDFGRRDPHRAALVRRLMQMGLTRAVADPVAAAVQEKNPGVGEAEALWRRALAKLIARVQIADEDMLTSGGVVALVGPTGVGKTTTIAKIAARFRMQHGANSAALLTTDNYRVGAQEQLRTYGQLMGLPVAVCGSSDAVHDAIERYRDRRLVLIDTAGMGQRDIRLAEQTALIQKGADHASRRLGFHLVLSATANHSTLDETVRAFADVPLDGCVVTKVDEATSLGGILSVLLEHALPAAFVCDGQRVPEDLALANAEQLVARAVQFARNVGERSEETLEMIYGGIAAHA